jgi:hypothetical protein
MKIYFLEERIDKMSPDGMERALKEVRSFICFFFLQTFFMYTNYFCFISEC